MKDCIQDFIAAWKHYDGLSAPTITRWSNRLAEGGYYSVPLTGQSLLVDLHDVRKWCEEQFGTRHYIWTGNVFWFENEHDAHWFALRWG
jgi:hypothetical protein